MFKFITRQHFVVNLLLAIGLFTGIIFIFLSSLDYITHHNEYEKVPDVLKKSLDEAYKELDGKGFVVEIQDSIWDPAVPPLSVVKQAPLGNEMVKANRRIFITVNRATPPLIDMPRFVGFSFRNAELYLKQVGLVLGDTSRKPDIAKDAVLEQLYNGQPIAPGTRIFMGSTISLVLGSGLGDEENSVPDIIGLTYSEAESKISAFGLNFGGIFLDPNVKDTASAFIYRQNPNATSPAPDGGKQVNKIRVGQSMDIWLRKDPPVMEDLMNEDNN